MLQLLLLLLLLLRLLRGRGDSWWLRCRGVCRGAGRSSNSSRRGVTHITSRCWLSITVTIAIPISILLGHAENCSLKKSI